LPGVDETTFDSFASATGIDIDPAKGFVLGRLAFELKNSLVGVVDDPVGCATVEVVDGVDDPAAFSEANIRYKNLNGDFKPLTKQDQTNQGNGAFLVANLTADVTLKAFVGEAPIGEAQAIAKPGAVTYVPVYTYTEETAPDGVAPVTVNPQPKPCTK